MSESSKSIDLNNFDGIAGDANSYWDEAFLSPRAGALSIAWIIAFSPKKLSLNDCEM